MFLLRKLLTFCVIFGLLFGNAYAAFPPTRIWDDGEFQGVVANWDMLTGLSVQMTGITAYIQSTGGGGTECSSSACDLNVDTELNSQGICLADGTDCPAAGAGDLLADGTVPMTANWDIGNFDITLKALTGDGTIEGATLTEGGNAVSNDTQIEAVVEPLIDTLANLSSIGGQPVAFADAGADAFWGWDDAGGAKYENLTAAEAMAIIGGEANDLDASGDVTDDSHAHVIANVDEISGGVGSEDMEAAEDFGDFTCDGNDAGCTLDASSVSDNEVDYTNVTCADLTLSDCDEAITTTGNGITLGDGAAGDPVITFNSGNNGTITWEEDGKDWEISDSVEIAGQVEAATYGSDGTVTDAELLYINSLSSNAQTQFSNILDGTTAFTDFNGADILDSDNYNAGSIDLEHMSSQSVDSDNIVDATIAIGDLANGTDGQLITWAADATATTVAAGTATHVLTSNGAGAAPTFQAAAAGGASFSCQLNPQQAKLPSSNPMTIDAGEDEWMGLFDDTTDECAYWSCGTLNPYGSGTWKATISYTLETTATSDVVGIEVYVMCVSDGDDLDTAAYGTVNDLSSGSVSTEDGFLNTLTDTSLNEDSCAEDDMVYIKVCRDADDVDTTTDDVEFRSGVIYEE